ncbi:MAG: SagB/ThcOx family dehydrogenase, partial [Haloarculaceae archaeon]
MVDARQFHEETKHSPESVRASSHRLNPRTKPRPYKVYRDLETVAPADPLEGPGTPALEGIANREPTPRGGDPAGGEDRPGGDRTDPPLHALCHYATGITKTLRRQGQDVPFRAAACTGKLYHVDCYLVTGDCGPAGPGVYHFDPHEDRFDVLREGDYRGVLAATTGGGTGVDQAPATVVLTSTWWRNAWKYRARTFRHAFWDSGTILANLLATVHGLGFRAGVVGAFADGPIVDLLGLDPDEEAPLELVPIGSGRPVADDGANRGGSTGVPPLDPATEPLSPEQVDYPLVPDAWRQGTLADGAAAADWRATVRAADAKALGRAPPGDGERVPLEAVDAETASGRPVGATIERRGSCREYARDPINGRRFATVLDRALRGVPGDWRASAS